MGTLITTSIMIKLLLTSSLLALTAAAEADQQLPPDDRGPLYVVDPTTYVSVLSTIRATESANVPPYPKPLPPYGGGGYATYGKRSADAEPTAAAAEADQQLPHYVAAQIK